MNYLPYQSDWPEQFQTERANLVALLGDRLVDIAHIGSTAVPGLSAKPIIDIAVIVENPDVATSLVEPLTDLGYQFHSSSTERHFFQKRDAQDFNLTLAYADRGSFWTRQLAFRDYLREHGESARDYAALKEDLIKQYPEGVGAYSEGKTDFVLDVLKKARWQEDQTYQEWLQR